MFSAYGFPAKHILPPKNGPVPGRPVNGYPLASGLARDRLTARRSPGPKSCWKYDAWRIGSPGGPGSEAEAGWNQLAADWRRLLTLWPATCLAGCLGDRLVATATLALFGPVGWIGMILVEQSQRRQGYGGEILARSSAAAMRRGWTASDSTPPISGSRSISNTVLQLGRASTAGRARRRKSTRRPVRRRSCRWPRRTGRR